MSLSGNVQIDRGFLEIQSRRFTIEQANASFDPSQAPSNPTLSATAVYDAPDGTLIYAEFMGTVEKGKLLLRSDPALTQTEILSLVVFGTREGGDASKGSAAAGTVATAASVGGGVATQGINKALAEVSPVEITTRVNTSDSQDPRPEVAVAITNKVSATVWYRLGLPLPGKTRIGR
jgi:autotransporter translocation and assembly factor TamB